MTMYVLVSDPFDIECTVGILVVLRFIFKMVKKKLLLN